MNCSQYLKNCHMILDDFCRTKIHILQVKSTDIYINIYIYKGTHSGGTDIFDRTSLLVTSNVTNFQIWRSSLFEKKLQPNCLGWGTSKFELLSILRLEYSMFFFFYTLITVPRNLWALDRHLNIFALEQNVHGHDQVAR